MRELKRTFERITCKFSDIFTGEKQVCLEILVKSVDFLFERKKIILENFTVRTLAYSLFYVYRVLLAKNLLRFHEANRPILPV